MHEVDRAIKIVSAAHPNCFLDLFYGHDRKIVLKSIEDAQIQIPEHRADKIWRVEERKDRECCVMLEAITVPDRRELRRINLKNAALQISLDLPVITILVYLERGKYASFPEGYEDELGGMINRHHFSRILLWEHEDRIRSGELKELAPFLPLFEDKPLPELLELEDKLLDSVADPWQRAELKAVAAVVAARRFPEELVKLYLKLEFDMIKEATIFKEWFDQIRTEAEKEGKIEGKLEGKLEGKIEIARKMLAKGLQLSLIAELTGVSEEEILHLSQDLDL